MANILIIVPPLTGHINPTVSLGQALIDRGHQVGWIGFESALKKSLPEGRTLHPLNISSSDEEGRHADLLSQRERRGFAGLHFLWERFLIPLAHQTFAEVAHLLTQLQPDLCIVDQQMLAGALACDALNIPFLTSSTTSASVLDALPELPQVAEWTTGLLKNLWNALQVPLPARAQLDLSSLGVLVFSSERLVKASRPDLALPSHLIFVGPALEGQRASIPFDWSRLNPSQQKLFFSMGTVNAERSESLYRRLIEALCDSDIQVIAAAPPEHFVDAPAHWIISERVPQLELLPHVNAVFCHGGHNTTLEALAFGLPLVIAPIRDDQPVIAEQVKAVNAGIRVHFQRAKPLQLRQVIERVLNDSTLKEAALALRAEIIGADHHSLDIRRLPDELGGFRGAAFIEKTLVALTMSEEAVNP